MLLPAQKFFPDISDVPCVPPNFDKLQSLDHPPKGFRSVALRQVLVDVDPIVFGMGILHNKYIDLRDALMVARSGDVRVGVNDEHCVPFRFHQFIFWTLVSHDDAVTFGCLAELDGLQAEDIVEIESTDQIEDQLFFLHVLGVLRRGSLWLSVLHEDTLHGVGKLDVRIPSTCNAFCNELVERQKDLFLRVAFCRSFLLLPSIVIPLKALGGILVRESCDIAVLNGIYGVAVDVWNQVAFYHVGKRTEDGGKFSRSAVLFQQPFERLVHLTDRSGKLQSELFSHFDSLALKAALFVGITEFAA